MNIRRTCLSGLPSNQPHVTYAVCTVTIHRLLSVICLNLYLFIVHEVVQCSRSTDHIHKKHRRKYSVVIYQNKDNISSHCPALLQAHSRNITYVEHFFRK